MMAKDTGCEVKAKEYTLKLLEDYKCRLEKQFFLQLRQNPGLVPGNDARLTCPLDFKQELRRERDTVELDEIASGASYSWDAFKNALEREPCHSAIVAFYRLVCPGSPDLFYKLTNYNLERNEAVHSNLPVDPNELVRQIETDLKSIQIADPDLAATFATTLTAIRDYITI